MAQLPGFRVSAPNVNNLFQPVRNALVDYRQAMDKQTARNDGLEQQEYQRGQDALRNEQQNALIAARQQKLAQGPGPTAGMQEYNFAKQQGFKGSFVDFKNSGQGTGGTKYINQDGNLIAIPPGGKPEIVFKKAPSLAERLLQRGTQGQTQQQPQGGFIQQSNPVQGGSDPNLHLTAGNEAQASQQQDMVEIPGIGQMPRSQAEALKSAFALEGNKAGADLLDSVLTPPSTQIGEAGSNEVDKQLINSSNALSRLLEIQRQFKPEFQTIEMKFGMAVNEWKDKFQATRGSIPPETRQLMEEYRKFRVTSIDNINRYIKEITGAQMSEAEAKRLRQGVPDPGDGIWSGDGPTTFKAKMDQTIRTLGLSQMRYFYLKKNGFAGTGEQAAGLMSLEKMGIKVDQRAQQLLQDAMSQGLEQGQAQQAVKAKLQQEFGLVI